MSGGRECSEWGRLWRYWRLS